MNFIKKLNPKQKMIIFITFSLVIISLIVWQAYGGAFWTKTQALVEIKDDLFDTTYREYQDKFVLGLDYTLAFDGIVIIAGLIGMFIFKKNKNA